MQVIYVLAEVLAQTSDFFARFDSPTPPTPADIKIMRGHVVRALAVFHDAKQLDADHIRLNEINAKLKLGGPNTQALVDERKEINARILGLLPRKDDSESVSLAERRQRAERLIQDDLDQTPLQQDTEDGPPPLEGGIDVMSR